MLAHERNLAMIAIAIALIVAPMMAGTVYAVPPVSTDTKVRAFQNGVQITDANPGVVGTDTECIGGIISADAVKMICILIPPGVPNNNNDNQIANLTTTTTIACPDGVGFGDDHVCFSVTFPGALINEGTNDEPGDWHFHAQFYDIQGNLIADGRQEFQNHSFFVVPETPIGIIALLTSSLAVLGGYLFLRGRSAASL